MERIADLVNEWMGRDVRNDARLRHGAALWLYHALSHFRQSPLSFTDYLPTLRLSMLPFFDATLSAH